MAQAEKTLYTPIVRNSMLELFEEDQRFRAESVLPVCPNEVVDELIDSIDIPRRDFWEQAKKFLD